MQLFRVSLTAITTFVVAASVPIHGQDGRTISPSVVGVTSAQDAYPDISPDGRYIAFQSNRSGTWQIWITQTDGTGLRRLTHSNANDTMPVWSPDGSKIMFASESANSSERDILVMDFQDETDPRPASTRRVIGGDTDDMHPEWIAGGTRIIFNRVNATQDGADIMVVDANGGGEQTIETAHGWHTYASMTKTGDRLVWRGPIEEVRDGETVENSEILIAGPDGASPCNLTEHPAFDGWPAISPDGEMIAFASNRSGQRFDVFIMPATGGEPRQITNDGTFNYTQPAWSPGGQRLAAYRWLEDEVADVGQVVLLDLIPTTE